ncbi:MAG: mevalonate kinase [Candidatus Diapherotrites archaeon]|nr:mevalonate kinase [Candidatus Diapherotrites archaeon]
MSKGIGYGKIILFGEHFVIYGLPAIAASIDLKTDVDLIFDPSLTDIKLSGVFNNEKAKEITNAILNNLGIKERSLFFNVKTNIPVASGLGSSAALSVAIARAINNTFMLGLSDKDICKASYEGEKVAHGNPSGVDNTVATYRGIILFERGERFEDNKIDPITIDYSIDIIIGNTGIKGNTKEVVMSVKKWLDDNPERAKSIFDEVKEIVLEAKESLKNKNLIKLGSLMNKNHSLLKEVGASCKELELLCETALEAGALGAKLVGSGGGGCMIALPKDKKNANEIVECFKELGFEAIITKIGGNVEISSSN